MMNGEIYVKSEKNKGSVFSFTVTLSAKENNQVEEEQDNAFGVKKIKQNFGTLVIEDINTYLKNYDDSMEEILKGEIEESYDKYISKLSSAIEAGNMELIEKISALIKEVANRKENGKVKSLAFKIQLMARRNDIESIKTYYDMLCKEIWNQ